VSHIKRSRTFGATFWCNPSATLLQPFACVNFLHGFKGTPAARQAWLGLAEVSGIFLTVPILAVAHFDAETAIGILQAGGTAAVLFGALLGVPDAIAATAAGSSILE